MEGSKLELHSQAGWLPLLFAKLNYSPAGLRFHFNQQTSDFADSDLTLFPKMLNYFFNLCDQEFLNNWGILQSVLVVL